MKKIFLFEPSIASENIGDQIIVDSIKNEMKELFSSSFCIELPTHTPISNRYMHFLGKSDYKFVLGSNIIVSDLNPIIHLKQWSLTPLTLPHIKNVILIGVGVQQYNQDFALLTRISYQWLFKGTALHSVRDSYTEKLLKNIGICNTINTGCPTMWSLTPTLCSLIPPKKATEVIFTLTDYKPNPERDNYMIDVLKHDYDKVFFWPQGHRDYSYFKTLDKTDEIEVINPHLTDYDIFLETHEVDFIGTRLHGGIRALQHKRRTIIIGVDNRAIELNRDFNLPVIHQDDISNLSQVINSNIKTEIMLPKANIKTFLSQFNINYNEKD